MAAVEHHSTGFPTEALSGLGRVTLPVASATRFNVKSAAGRADGVSPWNTKHGVLAGPGDQRLAERVWKLQHANLHCAPTGDCTGRDGMIGKQTMCFIAKEIAGRTSRGNWFAAALDIKQNSRLATSGACTMSCKDVACTYRAKVGCKPCSGSAPPSHTKSGSTLKTALTVVGVVAGLYAATKLT